MEISKTPVDIKTLIQTSSISKYNQTKLISKLQNNFNEEEQKLYIANLYLFLNYHPLNDFIINLDNVWKFIGFANKGNAKRLLQHNFTEDSDYKISLLRTEKQTERGGKNQETIMLNINTFKKLCLKANTKNADKIHDYYIKLENIYNDMIKEELDEQKIILENQQKELQEQNKKLQLLENKPQTHGFNTYRKGYVYIINDMLKPGHYKIGMAIDTDKRVRTLNTASSEKSLKIYYEIETYDMELCERTIQSILTPFNIKGRKEWFYFSDNNQLKYAIYVMNKTKSFLDTFKCETYEEFVNKFNNIKIDENDNEEYNENNEDNNNENNEEHNERIK